MEFIQLKLRQGKDPLLAWLLSFPIVTGATFLGNEEPSAVLRIPAASSQMYVTL